MSEPRFGFDKDFNFKHPTKKGWQRLPRALRDALIKSKSRPTKDRVYFCCFLVWDEDTKYCYWGQNVPLCQTDIIDYSEIEQSIVSVCLKQLKEEGLIDIDADNRIHPIENPKALKKPSNAEGSIEGAVTKYWTESGIESDADKLKRFLKWREEGRYWKKEIRSVAKLVVKPAKTVPKTGAEDPGLKSGPKMGPSGPNPKTPENSSGPNLPPLIEKEEDIEREKPTPPTPSPTSKPSAKTTEGAMSKSSVETNLEPVQGRAQFEELIGMFLALGRGSRSEADLRKCEQLWKDLPLSERIAAYRHAVETFPEWQTRPTSKIPQPWNYLSDQHWKRKVERVLPQTREKSKGQLAQEELERRVLGKSKEPK